MNKILIILLFTLTYGLFSFNRSYATRSPESISFKNNKLTITTLEDNTIKNIESEYRLFTRESIPFLSFFSDKKYYEYVFLSSDNFAFFANDNYNSELLFNPDSLSDHVFSFVENFGINPIESLAPTSTFEEINRDYSIENSQKSILIPWVEGANGPGINEKIFIKYKESESNGAKYLLLSNGFVSASDPSLFKKNNRLKKVRIESIDKGFSIVFNLQDTPNIQELYLPEPANELIITILDVYKGSKWDDTCINYLVGVREDKKLEKILSK